MSVRIVALAALVACSAGKEGAEGVDTGDVAGTTATSGATGTPTTDDPGGGGTTPATGTAGGTTPGGGTAPGGTTPSETTPGGETTPSETTPSETTPSETTPGGGTTPGDTGVGALPDGFEVDLTDLFGCLGKFHATDAADTIALSFDANDLGGAAFIAQVDTVTVLDMGVDAWRMEVLVGTGVTVDLCGVGSPVIEAVYTPIAGEATVSVFPHKTQAEQTEGILVLDGVVLEAPGQPDVTLGHLEFPQLVFTAL